MISPMAVPLARMTEVPMMHPIPGRVDRCYRSFEGSVLMNRIHRICCLLLLASAGSLHAIAGTSHADDQQQANWPAVGNDRGAGRYADLQQINRDNVSRLEVAWTFHTGELKPDGSGKTIECTPIVIDGVMYVTTGAPARRRPRRRHR